MHDLGEKSVLRLGKKYDYFIRVVHTSLLKAIDYVQNFVLKTLDISNMWWDQNSYLPQSHYHYKIADVHNISLRLWKPISWGSESIRMQFFVITGEKDRKAIKTRERHYFLKVTQRYGREWKLRSVLIKPDISDIIIMPSLSLFCTFQKGHTRWFVIWTSTIIHHMPVLGGTWWILKAKVAWHSAGNNNVIQALGLFVQ